MEQSLVKAPFFASEKCLKSLGYASTSAPALRFWNGVRNSAAIGFESRGNSCFRRGFSLLMLLLLLMLVVLLRVSK